MSCFVPFLTFLSFFQCLSQHRLFGIPFRGIPYILAFDIGYVLLLRLRHWHPMGNISIFYSINNGRVPLPITANIRLYRRKRPFPRKINQYRNVILWQPLRNRNPPPFLLCLDGINGNLADLNGSLPFLCHRAAVYLRCHPASYDLALQQADNLLICHVTTPTATPGATQANPIPAMPG